VVTSMHDGADWVQLHAPRALFEHLAQALDDGDLDEVGKWLAVWASDRQSRDPDICGKPTLQGSPCHYNTGPCPYHRRTRTARPASPTSAGTADEDPDDVD
jgi:hypothetical protein